ncbi:MAG: L-rhamnose isomerase [Lentisphaeria bacterium]|nr:L-rhamnose isomerase [Lentisphaeria bacterium]
MKAFDLAKEVYAALGVDVESALGRVNEIPVSIHCWQGDDVNGFENDSALDGGIAVTGHHPGRARNADELRSDLDEVWKLVPGPKRLNIHAIYAETGGKKVSRDELTIDHFSRWIDWAKSSGSGLDFNPTCFSHPLASEGFTVSSPDAGVRDFWIRHCIACREIAAAMGRILKNPCVTNFWFPDGFKDTPYDRLAARERLRGALDEIFEKEIPREYNLDAVESKLFGIGAESCTVGSHEFYMGYAVSRGKLLCLDAGHFHPTEVISDKISSCLLYLDEILLHVSRGVRWDSDHVVTLNDELLAIAQEIIRHGFDKRVHIGLDYFDGSIDRIAAWAVGGRNMRKALLQAALEPASLLRAAEESGDNARRLALLEECRTLPFAPVWEEFCRRCGVPGSFDWYAEIERYRKDVTSKR